MLVKYKTMFSFRSQDHNKHILQSKKRKQKVNAKEDKPVYGFMINNYKLFNAKSVVDQWRKYINIFGWFLIIYGSLELIVKIFSILLVDSVEYEVIKPDGSSDSIYSSIIWEMIDRILSNCWCVGIIFIGTWKLCFKDSAIYITIFQAVIRWRNISSLPTKSETWKLWKTAIYITIFQAVIIWMKFFFAEISIIDVYIKWMNRIDIPAGNYIFRNKSTGDEYKYKKPVAISNIDLLKESNTEQRIISCFSMSVYLAISWSWFYLAIYCSLTLLALFRFHSATKELEIMVEFSSIREMSLNRQESSSISQEQSTPHSENDEINIIPDL